MNDEWMRQLSMQQAFSAQTQMGNSFATQSGLASLLGQSMGVQPGGTYSQHLGLVKDFRKKFKEYTKEEFRHISKEPVVKNILTGLTVLNKDQIAERIKEHLED